MDSFEPGTITEDGKEILKTLPLTGTRRAIKENLSVSLQTTAQASSFIKPDLTGLVEFKDKLKAAGHNVSYTVLFIKAAAVALQKEPSLNSATVDKKIVMYKSVNMAVGIPGPKDLLYVPVIKNVEKKGLIQISDELKGLIKKVTEGTLEMESMTGATFTLSSLGMYEVGGFTPILNLPAAAIMGIGNIFYEPAVDENKNIVIRPTAYFSVTIDHAIINGVAPLRLYKELKEVFKEPEKYLYL